jgi:hypothetical protein
LKDVKKRLNGKRRKPGAFLSSTKHADRREGVHSNRQYEETEKTLFIKDKVKQKSHFATQKWIKVYGETFVMWPDIIALLSHVVAFSMMY